MNNLTLIDKVLSDPVAIATLVLALVTAVLAGGAFLTVRQNYSFRRKEKKEKLLNEIIEWLKELQDHVLYSDIKIFKELQEDIDLRKKKELPQEIVESARRIDRTLAEWHSLSGEIREGEYNQKVALRFDKGLGRLLEISGPFEKAPVSYLGELETSAYDYHKY